MNFEAEDIPKESLPIPCGWRLLIAPVKINDKTDGGIILTDESKKVAKYFVDIGKVLAMGETAFEHPKFQGGIPIEDKMPKPWCNVGDVICYNSYTGKDINLTHEGESFKLKFINDDEVVSVISDLSLFNFM